MNEFKNGTAPLLSVCIITYNQQNWISQAIEGALMQKTSFPIELILADDCSTDETIKVIQQYQKNFPNIKLIKNHKNLGLNGNFSNALNHCSGKYIAICEGDDYWTSDNKLQTQVDFMENNLDVVLTTHNFSKYIVEKDELISHYKQNSDFKFDQSFYLTGWFTQPVTCVFRNTIKDYTSLNRDGIFCDVILFYELLKNGNGFFFKEDWAVFRVNNNALSSGLSEFSWYKNHILMYSNLLKYNKDDNRLKKLIANYRLLLIVYTRKNKNNNNITFLDAFKDYVADEIRIMNLLKTIFVRVPYYFIKY